MSLIEDALDKAEKERIDSQPLPSRLTDPRPLQKKRKSEGHMRVTVAIVAVVCLALSIAWLGYWWYHYQIPHTPNHMARRKAPHLYPSQKTREKTPPSSPSPESLTETKNPPPVQKPVKTNLSPPVTTHETANPQMALSRSVLSPKSSKKTFLPKANHETASPLRYKRKHPGRKTRDKKRKVTSGSHKMLNLHQSTSLERGKISLPMSIRIAREYIRKGLAAYQAGNFPRAAHAFENSLIYAEPTPQTLALLGKIYLRLGKGVKAYGYAKKALSKNPADPNLQEEMGFILMTMGQMDQAIPYYLHAIQAHPFRYTLHVNLGIAYWKIGNLGAARDQFLTAIKIRKDRPEAYYNLSGVYEALGDYPHALASLEKFLETAPVQDAAQRHVALRHIRALKSYLQEKRGVNRGQ